MKLLSCHVENFGKLCCQDFLFSDGLNVWKEENGWGKSTLAAFLKVMFYGFENERKRAALEKEREKYRPWQGGIYGGNVVFKAEKKTYRIERIFGEREREDKFWIYEESTGLESEDYTEEVGRELFGIDSFSFQKSIYIVQNQCKMEPTDTIHAKLGNPLETTWDLEHYAMAQRALEKEIYRLDPNRKNGELASIETEMKQLSYNVIRLNKRLEQETQIEERLMDNRKQQELLESNQQSLQQEWHQQEIGENNRILREHYQELCKKYEEKEERLEALEGYFINGIPTEKEIRGILGLAEEEFRNQVILEQLSLSQKEEEILQWIREHWNDEIPDKNDLTKCRQWIEEIQEHKKRISMNFRKDKEILSAEECKQILRIGIICIILGILLFAVTYLGGGILLGIGIFCLILGIRKKDKEENKETKDNVGDTENITEFLSKYPIQEKKEWAAHLQQIEFMARVGKEGQIKRKKLENALEHLYGVTEKIEEFFLKYGMHKQENTNIQLQEMLVKLENYRLAEADFTEITTEKENFSCEYPIVLLSQEEEQREPSIERNQNWQQNMEDMKQLSIAIQEDIRQLEAMEELKRQIEEYKKRLEHLKAEKEKKEKQLDIWRKTSEYLQKAKESFAAKYRTPMEKGVEKYVGYLTNEDISLHIDVNLELKKREKGALRSLVYYSQGWQDLFGICMRLALVDAMYPFEKPFLILDDPFVNMDEEKIEGGMLLLERVSKEYQVLYFTCHDGRRGK